ncbi:hypothetical protein F0Q34_20700 [Pseudoroseomonas oryzae]|uniref:Polysaccharide biosynthesis enzyme WcbI domain-containing protein n=1 Tax=Teichococcus oryzae TaxID=1608942 RepID=A0A5B2T9M2_9PROT|nr:hypothetical protein F0Q34_20700 [Pseudoroseomonas oryzae]
MSEPVDLPGVNRGQSKRPDAKRVLFYGACHASIFASVFSRWGTRDDFVYDYATNWRMVLDGTPFPYDAVSQWDTIVFSPIENKEGYETWRVVEACKANGVRSICYPHLHWRGYFPKISKGRFFAGDEWHFPEIAESASASRSYEEFVRQVSELHTDAVAIQLNAEESTRHLELQEKTNQTAFRISDYIRSEYRNQRLFMTPGHPTQVLYAEAIRRLNEHLGHPLDPSYYYVAEEPQRGLKTPIPPNVHRALGLKFADADTQFSNQTLGARTIAWPEYLRLTYGYEKGTPFFKSNTATFLKARPDPIADLEDIEKVSVPRGAVLQASQNGAALSGHAEMSLSWLDSVTQKKVARWQKVYLFREHWQEIAPDRA